MTAYVSLVIDEDDRADGLMRLARQAWQHYQDKIPEDRRPSVGLAPFKDIQQTVLNRLLNSTNGIPPEAKAILRQKLNLPPEKTPPTAPTEQSAAAQDKKAP